MPKTTPPGRASIAAIRNVIDYIIPPDAGQRTVALMAKLDDAALLSLVRGGIEAAAYNGDELASEAEILAELKEDIANCESQQ